MRTDMDMYIFRFSGRIDDVCTDEMMAKETLSMCDKKYEEKLTLLQCFAEQYRGIPFFIKVSFLLLYMCVYVCYYAVI